MFSFVGEKKLILWNLLDCLKLKKKVVPFYYENSKIKVKEYARRRGCGETYVLAHCGLAGPAAAGLLMSTRAPSAGVAAGPSPMSPPVFLLLLVLRVSV